MCYCCGVGDLCAFVVGPQWPFEELQFKHFCVGPGSCHLCLKSRYQCVSFSLFFPLSVTFSPQTQDLHTIITEHYSNISNFPHVWINWSRYFFHGICWQKDKYKHPQLHPLKMKMTQQLFSYHPTNLTAHQMTSYDCTASKSKIQFMVWPIKSHSN